MVAVGAVGQVMVVKKVYFFLDWNQLKNIICLAKDRLSTISEAPVLYYPVLFVIHWKSKLVRCSMVHAWMELAEWGMNRNEVGCVILKQKSGVEKVEQNFVEHFSWVKEWFRPVQSNPLQ